MSIIDRLTEIVLGRTEPPQALVLSSRLYAEAMIETFHGSYLPHRGEQFAFLGVPVRTKRYTTQCRSCGAPAEGKACSYCGTDPDEVGVL